MSDTETEPQSTATVALTSLWLAPASKERITAGFAAEITEGLDSASSADVVVVSTRMPRVRMGSIMERLTETTQAPIVVLCHAGGEAVARDLLKHGATHVIAEGNEAIIAHMVDAGPGVEPNTSDGSIRRLRTPDAEPLLNGFTFHLEHRKHADDDDDSVDSGIDPVTHLPNEAAFAVRFSELTQRERLPRVGFVRLANRGPALEQLDRPTLDLVRRRLALQFRNLIAEQSVELFMTGPLDLAILSNALTEAEMDRLARGLVRSAESFAPTGREPIRLAVGYAGPEVATDARTLMELAESATAAAIAHGGGVFSGDELALSRANATEHATAESLARWVDDTDYHGGGHGARVAELCAVLGRELGIDGIDLIRLRLAARLHDIGKLQMSDDTIAAVPAELSGDDLDTYRRHPEIGATFFSLSVNDDVASAVKHHHEAWDGSGFPDALDADDIPFGARVIAVADHVDRLVRVDRLDHRGVIEALEATSGAQHDPSVVWAALTLLRTGAFDPILFPDDVAQR